MAGEPREAFEGIKSATILRPGDSVLLVLDGWPTPRQMEDIQQRLGDRFPDVAFTIASCISDVVVRPAVPSSKEPTE
jgi:hypothetical protein